MTTPTLLASNNPLNATSWNGISSTYYLGLGNLAAKATTSTETDVQTTERTSSTLSKIYALVTVNSRLSASTLRSRKNTANGNCSVSITAGVTGTYMDSTHSDSLAAGDLFNLSLVNGTGSQAITIASFGAQYDSATDAYSHYRVQQDGTAPTSSSASTTQHFNIAGGWNILFQSADTDMKFPCRAGGDYSNYYINASANARSTATTSGLRVTGAAGNNLISLGATTTGTIEDTTPHTDTVTNSDKLSAYIITGTGTGTITWQNAGVMFKGTGSKTDLVAHISNSKARGTTSDTFVHLTGMFSSITNTTESLAQDVFPFICRLSNFRVTGSTVNSTNTFRVRINGSSGNQSCSVSASGVTEDTTNHDDTAANDLVGVMISSAAATTSNWDGVAATIGVVPAPTTGSGSALIQLGN